MAGTWERAGGEREESGGWWGRKGRGRVSEIIQCVILCTRDTTAKLHVSAFALHSDTERC